MRNKQSFYGFLCAGLLVLPMVNVDARQFRKIAPIPTAPTVVERQIPSAGKQVVTGTGAGATSAVDNFKPVDSQLIEAELNKIVASWNSDGLENYLDQAFPNKFQLLSILNRDVPQDAQLQLLQIQNISTLEQHWQESIDNRRQRISNVIATLRLQIRFVDPRRGLVLLPHTSQFYLNVVEAE